MYSKYCETLVSLRKVQPPYIYVQGEGRLKTETVDIYQSSYSFIYFSSIMFSSPFKPQQPQGSVDLCRFALKNGRVSFHESRDLCCFARKAIVRRRESTIVIVVSHGSISCGNRTSLPHIANMQLANQNQRITQANMRSGKSTRAEQNLASTAKTKHTRQHTG